MKQSKKLRMVVRFVNQFQLDGGSAAINREAVSFLVDQTCFLNYAWKGQRYVLLV